MANGQRQLDALERQMTALKRRMSGNTYESIAKELGYATAGGAHKAVMAALKKTLQEPSDEMRALEVGRLDELLVTHWPNRKQPQITDRILRIMERRAKLLGLDAPAKTELTGSDGGGLKVIVEYANREADITGISQEPTGDS